MPEPLGAEDVMRALPGTGEIMASVGRSFGNCWHAARGGNWDLAAYFVRRVRGRLRTLVIVRPKYREQVADYDRDHMEPLYQAVMARNWSRFELEYRRSVERANEYHVETGHPYIRWQAPAVPPDPGLDFRALDFER